jgi:hypothetical protein
MLTILTVLMELNVTQMMDTTIMLPPVHFPFALVAVRDVLIDLHARNVMMELT